MNANTPAIAERFSAGMSGGGEPTVMRMVLRHKWKILAFAVVMTGVAFVVVRGLPVRYTADASVELGAPQLQVLNNTSVVSAPTLDLDRLRTEMEAFRSPAIVQAVVQQLGLASRPEFCGPPPVSLVTRLTRLWRAGAPVAEQAACEPDPEAAAKQLASMVGISNDGRSYIVHVSAEAGDPELAAAIANAYATAYVTEQRQRLRGDMEMADEWLGSYLAKLRQQTQDADAAVAAYREQHQLTPLRGETVVAQSLAELNSQLTLATSQLADKQAVLSQVRGLAAGGLGASAPAMASPVIQSLLEKRAELMSTAADLQSQYGSAHPKVQAAAAQIARLNQQIGVEVGKSVTALTGEVAALSARRAALTAQVQALQGSAAEEQQEDVHLQQLRREADADQQLYQAMTIRLKEIDAEQGMQRASAHVVVAATRPDFPSFPRTKMMLAGSFMAALGVGAGAAVAGGFLSRRYRDIDQVELETGLRVLGIFPRPTRRGAPHNAVVDRPMSLEAEALQAILIGLTRRMRGAARPMGHTVMVASALPGEGKTSFALALGRAASAASLSVAVLDCDLRRPSLRRLAEGRAGGKGGKAGKAAAGNTAEEAVDPRSGLHIIPIASGVRSPRQLLGAVGLDPIIAKLRAHYDLIILDTPPVLAVPDALTLAPLADDVLLLTSWQQTPRGAVSAAVDRLRRNAIDVTGIVLTKVDLRTFQRSGDGFRYYAKHYPGYTDPLAIADARV